MLRCMVHMVKVQVPGWLQRPGTLAGKGAGMKSLHSTFRFVVLFLITLAACAPGPAPAVSTPSLEPINLAGPEMKIGASWLYADGSLIVQLQPRLIVQTDSAEVSVFAFATVAKTCLKNTHQHVVARRAGGRVGRRPYRDQARRSNLHWRRKQPDFVGDCFAATLRRLATT